MQSSFEVYSLLNILQTMKTKLGGQTWKISFLTIWTPSGDLGATWGDDNDNERRLVKMFQSRL